MPIFVKSYMRKGREVKAHQRRDSPAARKRKSAMAKAARERAHRIQAYRKRG